MESSEEHNRRSIELLSSHERLMLFEIGGKLNDLADSSPAHLAEFGDLSSTDSLLPSPITVLLPRSGVDSREYWASHREWLLQQGYSGKVATATLREMHDTGQYVGVTPPGCDRIKREGEIRSFAISVTYPDVFMRSCISGYWMRRKRDHAVADLIHRIIGVTQ